MPAIEVFLHLLSSKIIVSPAVIIGIRQTADDQFITHCVLTCRCEVRTAWRLHAQESDAF